jgi:hypothetical protein
MREDKEEGEIRSTQIGRENIERGVVAAKATTYNNLGASTQHIRNRDKP